MVAVGMAVARMKTDTALAASTYALFILELSHANEAPTLTQGKRRPGCIKIQQFECFLLPVYCRTITRSKAQSETARSLAVEKLIVMLVS
jgi:hypothetical protein